MEFLEYTKMLNQEVMKLQDGDEDISLEDLIKAIFCMNNMLINDTGDCLIFLAAVNLCNSYVKKDKSKISYSFKKGIEYIISVLNYRKINDIYVNFTLDKGKLYLFQIGDIQFSFHDEKKVDIDSLYLRDLSWDGVRKQGCAKYIFDSALDNKLRVSGITYRGKNLLDKVDSVLDNYRENKVDLEDLLRFKL